MLLTIKASGRPEIKPSTIKATWYHAQVYKVFPVQPTRFNTEGHREYGIIYSLLSKTGTYETYAETFPVVTGPTSTLLKLLIAITGKRLTSKSLEGRQFDPEDLTGKHLSLLFSMNDRGSPRIAERNTRKSSICPQHDFTVAEAYVLPSYIKPEVINDDSLELQDVSDDVDLTALLKPQTPAPVEKLLPVALPPKEPQAVLPAQETPELVKPAQSTSGTLSDIVGFDCSTLEEDPVHRRIIVDIPVKELEIDLADFDIA